MALRDIVRLFVAVNVIALVLGHGMMIDPASRNSAWKYFPKRPVQYTDNELNCGGFSVQWQKNKGKCGVCGDPYHVTNPKYVYPGKYAKDRFITKTYREGQTIKVTIEITSNHQGSFRFSVGKVMKRPITQEQLTYVLLQPDGSNRWQLHSSANGKFHINLVLPKGLTCDHCVIQWWWRVGNNWGCDDDGNCGEGLNKQQETFVNCADIKITPAGGPAPTTKAPSTDMTMRPTTAAPSTKRPTTRNPSTESPSTQGPQTQAPLTPSEVPPTPSATASPPGGCKAKGPWAEQPGMDAWCANNCKLGNCPSTHCVCT